MNSIILAILFTAVAPQFDVQTLDGRTLSGDLLTLTAERLTIAAKQGKVSLDTRDVLTITSKRKPAQALRSAAVLVELVDGSLIHARQYLAHDNLAWISLADGETVETPAAAIRTVQFSEGHSSATDSEWSRLMKMKADADLLIVRADEGLDYHKGVLHEVTEDVVRFELDGEVLPVKRAKVLGFVYRHGVGEMPPAVCRITDADGSRWSVQSLAMAQELRWTTPSGLNVMQTIHRIAEIDFSGGKLVYLGDLQPETVAWTPYFGVGSPLPSASRFHAPRMDRGFDSGPLQLGGKVYGKGMAVYCRTELLYRLPERFRRFQAIAGIDDGVRPRGKARLVIRGDDKVLFEAEILGSDAPRAIDVDLRGVRRLSILVDFDGGLGAGDRMLLCNARTIQ